MAEEKRDEELFWGLPWDFIVQIVTTCPDDYTLQQWLNTWTGQGVISFGQATEIRNYVDYAWGKQETALAGAKVPAAPSAFDAYARWIGAGQPKLAAGEWERLQKGLEMEREEAREKARIATARERELELRPPAAPLPPVPEPFLGERWTPAARAYEERRAVSWYQRELAKRRAEEAAEEEALGEPSRGAQAFAGEHGISAHEAMRLGGGYVTGGGGMLGEGELEQLQAMSPEIRRELTSIGREVVREPRRRAELVEPYVPPLEAKPGIAGSPTWKEWFERKFGEIALEYVARPFRERRPETWAEFLKKREAETHEAWWQRGAWARGERPQVFQPAIKTVGF